MSRKGERGPEIVMFFSAFTCVCAIPFFAFNFQPMSAKQWLFLLLAGCAAAGGQLSITAAYRHAPAKEISVFDYSQIVYAALWGFLVFGEIPDALSFVGRRRKGLTFQESVSRGYALLFFGIFLSFFDNFILTFRFLYDILRSWRR